VRYTISKEFTFSYSHTLDGLPDGHQCARLHGHNAVVRVELAADRLDATGFVIDYGDLSPLGKWLDGTFDHRHLNDTVEFNPTAENLAAHVYQWCQRRGWPVTAVGWSETPKTWATYRGEP
jgi:6-pyruvoyltetrahydropterin/6-carboxytetrahydropterin synthase